MAAVVAATNASPSSTRRHKGVVPLVRGRPVCAGGGDEARVGAADDCTVSVDRDASRVAARATMAVEIAAARSSTALLSSSVGGADRLRASSWRRGAKKPPQLSMLLTFAAFAASRRVPFLRPACFRLPPQPGFASGMPESTEPAAYRRRRSKAAAGNSIPPRLPLDAHARKLVEFQRKFLSKLARANCQSVSARSGGET